jgi:anti-anti-sigma factor
MASPQATRLHPKIESSGAILVVTFTGCRTRTEVNMIAGELSCLGHDMDGRHLFLDFRQVSYVNGAELGTLVALHRKMKASGGRLTLFNLEGLVEEVFGVTGLDYVLEICRQKPASADVTSMETVSCVPHVIAFDVDDASMVSLRQAFPDWELQVIHGGTIASLERDRSPKKAGLLVVAAGAEMELTLGLCRGLRSLAGRAQTPLVVLVPRARSALVRAVLAAGADSCLILPVHAKELTGALTRARAGNQPGRHTLNLDRPQCNDPWRDEGGEA